MKRSLLLTGVLLFWALPATAAIFVQCPTQNSPAESTPVWNNYSRLHDDNGDGVLRADQGEIDFPLYGSQVCIHLASGDGFTTMADGVEQYIFGFTNATDPKYYDESNLNYESVMSAFALGAQFPSPTLTVKQNDHVYLSLTNVGMVMRPDLPDPHTVHWHGFPNAASVYDGVPDASISIGMGATLTYYYHVVQPGTFLYHCHVEATEHMQMGMLGNLYVTPAQDDTAVGATVAGGSYVMQAGDRFAYNDGDGSTRYDKDYPIQIHSFDPDFHQNNLDVQPLPFAAMEDRYPMFNGRGYPDTANPASDLSAIFPPSATMHGDKARMSSLIWAQPGDRVLLRISSLSTTSFHTLTVLGLPMQVVGVGSEQLAEPYFTQSVNIGGGESIDVLVDTTGTVDGEKYYLYTTNLEHLANFGEDYGGMMTEILISNTDPFVP